MREKERYQKNRWGTRRTATADALFVNGLRERPLADSVVMKEVGYPVNTAIAKSGEVKTLDIVAERMRESEMSIKDACTVAGLTPMRVAGVMAGLMEHEDWRAKQAAADFSMKVGVGGGYAPLRSQSVAVAVSGDVSDFQKYRSLTDEFDARLRNTALAEGKDNTTD